MELGTHALLVGWSLLMCLAIMSSGVVDAEAASFGPRIGLGIPARGTEDNDRALGLVATDLARRSAALLPEHDLRCAPGVNLEPLGQGRLGRVAPTGIPRRAVGTGRESVQSAGSIIHDDRPARVRTHVC